MAGPLPALFDVEVLDAQVGDPALRDGIAAAVRRADEEGWVQRLVEYGDDTLWGVAPDEGRTAGPLAWLNGLGEFPERTPALEGFGEGIREAGFSGALILGPDGGGLAAGVLVDAFRDVDGWLGVRILESAEPAAAAVAWAGLDPLSTLVVLSPGAGPTPAAVALLADAWKRIEAALRAAGERRESPGEFIVAITDGEHGLGGYPHHDDFREVFINPQPIAPPHSGISYPGLIPASLAGLDIDALVTASTAMGARVHAVDPAANPAVALGAVIGVAAAARRDALLLIVDEPVQGLARWLARLLAGAGLRPRILAGPGDAAPAGGVILRIILDGSAAPAGAAAACAAAADAGGPVLTIRIADPIDLAGEFVRWGVAMAVAGAILRRNPYAGRPLP